MIAPVRRANREGMLIDAAADHDMVTTTVRSLHQSATLESGDLKIAFRASKRFANAPLAPIEAPHLADGEQSNSTVLVDSAYVLKFYRRLVTGPSPEADIGRFLTDVAQRR
jgi:maltose alpha-D-glucosyltransferase/alpha-amylase